MSLDSLQVGRYPKKKNNIARSDAAALELIGAVSPGTPPAEIS